MPVRFAIVIPVCDSPAALLDLVRALDSGGVRAIVIVDDGSGADSRGVFERAAALPSVFVLRHAVPLGRGAALKTAINYALCEFPGLAGVVTADSVDPSEAADILRVADALEAQPDCLIMGSRAFGEETSPLRRMGDAATGALVQGLLGRKVADPETGLRGIPAAMLPKLLRVESNGREFELEMLIAANRLATPVVDLAVSSARITRSSEFNPLVDSMKLYFVLMRFSVVSLLTAMLDSAVYYLVWKRFGNLLAAQVVGRAAAVCFNYTMVRSSVFLSRQRHQTALPKYLLLVAGTGAVSYGGIKLLNARFGVAPVAAKLAVEGVLFFASFAIQRLFIFKPKESDQAERPPAPALVGALGATLLAVVVAAEGYGFAASHLFAQEIWSPVGLTRFVRYAAAYLLFTLPLLLIFPWTFAGLMSLLIIGLTILSVGIAPIAAVAYFLISSCAAGSLLLGRKAIKSIEDQILATLFGASAFICVMGLTARSPVNYPAAWAILLAVPIVADWRGAWRRLLDWGNRIRSAEFRSGWERAAFAVLVFVLVAHWFVALKPETGADGLSMHLAIPMNIADHHAITFQPAKFVWAVMPMGADWAFSIVYLLGGEYAARLLDFAMLLVLAGMLYCAARRFVGPASAFLLTALFATTPMVQLVTGSLFAENQLAALLFGCMAALWRFGETGARRYVYLTMALGGTALATKFGAISFLALILCFAGLEMWRRWKALGPRPLVPVALAILLLAGTAAPTYVIAYAKTGDPLFPFLNRTFPSRLIDQSVTFADYRFHEPMTWRSPYRMTFETTHFYEGQNGSFGFQYLLLAPLALLALLAMPDRVSRSAALVALGASILTLREQGNVRYIYPALPLLTVSFAAMLRWAASHRPWMSRALLAYAAVCLALNTYFLPTSSYYHKDFCLRAPFSRAERQRYLTEAAPIRPVIAYLNRAHPNAPVLLVSDSTFAGATGEVYENHWHQYNTSERLRAAQDLPDMVKTLNGWKVSYLITHKPGPGSEPLRPPLLQTLMDQCTVPEYEAGDYYLARLEPGCEDRTAPARGPTVFVQPGFYDDVDPAIIFRGDWDHDQRFADADRSTITYTDVPGAELSMGFEGTALTYIFTKAPNRGIASLTIDGVEKARIDLYAPDIAWQTKEKFCCLAPGKHIVVLRVTGEHGPNSSGRFVDLDSFLVQ